MKIHVIPDVGYSPNAIALYKKHGRTSVITRGFPIPIGTEVLVVRLEDVTPALIDSLPALNVIGSSTTGENHIDRAYAQSKGIRVVTLKGKLDDHAITSTAEHTIGLIIACLRNYPRAFTDDYRFPGARMSGKTLGLVGYGRIGKMVGQYASIMGMKVLFTDQSRNNDLDSRQRTLEKLFYQSDIISVHCSLADGTKGLIRKSLFDCMNPGSYLINTARPDIVNTPDLLDAIDKGIILRAAVDMAPCDPETTSALRTYATMNPSQLILTPHLGGCTIEDMALTEEILANLVFTSL